MGKLQQRSCQVVATATTLPKSFEGGIKSACVWVGSDLRTNVLRSFGQGDEFREENTDCGCSLFLLAERWNGNSAKWKPGSRFWGTLALISVDLQEVTNRAVGLLIATSLS